LVPAYWDEATASRKELENVSVELGGQGGGVASIAVDPFTGYVLLAGSGRSLVFLPLIAR
jgi:hypothetical protein